MPPYTCTEKGEGVSPDSIYTLGGNVIGYDAERVRGVRLGRQDRKGKEMVCGRVPAGRARAGASPLFPFRLGVD
jgi:hypothetical protein